jgi:hypothetical protein
MTSNVPVLRLMQMVMKSREIQDKKSRASGKLARDF